MTKEQALIILMNHEAGVIQPYLKLIKAIKIASAVVAPE